MFQIEHFGNCVCLSLCYDPVRRNNCLVLPSEAAPPGPEHSPCLLRKLPEIFSLWKLSMLFTFDCHQFRFSTVWNATEHVMSLILSFLWSDHDHRTLLFSKIQCLYLFLFLCLCLLVMKCFQCDHDFPQDNHCFHHEDLLITQTNIIILGNWPQKPV